MSAVRREQIEVSVDDERGVFMISVAAELAHMHPQTLRMYEARGLIEPQRSAKNTRLYSQRDVERLRHIQRLTSTGLNLAGVEIVLEMEAEVERMRAKLERMRRRRSTSSCEYNRVPLGERFGSINPRASYMRSVCGCISASSAATEIMNTPRSWRTSTRVVRRVVRRPPSGVLM